MYNGKIKDISSMSDEGTKFPPKKDLVIKTAYVKYDFSKIWN